MTRQLPTTTHQVEIVAGDGRYVVPALPLRRSAHPLDRHAEFCSLLFDPLPRFLRRGAELCRRRALGGRTADEGGEEFVVTSWLDPGEQFAPLRHMPFPCDDDAREYKPPGSLSSDRHASDALGLAR